MLGTYERRKFQAEDLNSVKALKLEVIWNIGRMAGGQSGWRGVMTETKGHASHEGPPRPL